MSFNKHEPVDELEYALYRSSASVQRWACLFLCIIATTMPLVGCQEAKSSPNTVRKPENVPQPSERGGGRFEGKAVKIPQ